jgi:hypothetical protein
VCLSILQRGRVDPAASVQAPLPKLLGQLAAAECCGSCCLCAHLMTCLSVCPSGALRGCLSVCLACQGLEEPVFQLRRGGQYRLRVALHHGAGADMVPSSLRWLRISCPPGRAGRVVTAAVDCAATPARTWVATAEWDPAAHE